VSSTALVNIGVLATCDRSIGHGVAGLRRDAAMVIADGTVRWVGASASVPEGIDETVDVAGRCVVPGFVDSHTHLVFAGDRADEFAARAAGERYRAGGILRTVTETRGATTEALAALARGRRDVALRQGTTTIESKSGYGLTCIDEARSCDVANDVADVATFLGAHVVAPEFADDPDGYVALVCGAMLEACAESVEFIDVFCERGAFDADQARAILSAGSAAGLRAKVHANQLGHGDGVRVAVEAGAVSADHCTYLDDADVEALAGSSTVATLLPITEFATRTAYADARRLLDAGATVALASNCNPGSGYSTSMALAIALGVREQGFSPDEALAAATLGGAAALGRSDVGHLAPGARADLVVLDAPTPVHLSYRPGMDLVAAVWRDGRRVA